MESEHPLDTTDDAAQPAPDPNAAGAESEASPDVPQPVSADATSDVGSRSSESDMPPDATGALGGASTDLPVDENLAKMLAAEQAQRAARAAVPVTPQVEVSPAVGDDRSPLPLPIRVVVEFRNAAQSGSGEATAMPGDDESLDAAAAHSEDRSEAASGPADHSGGAPDVLEQLDAIERAEAAGEYGPGLPLALPVRVYDSEAIIRRTLAEVTPHLTSELNDISQRKYNELLYFLFTEETRLGWD